MLSRRTGIYAIECTANHSWYVGQSIDVVKRKSAHLNDLRAGRHGNKRLQNNFNKYGEAALIFHVIEDCAAEVLTKREQFYYDYFKDTLKRDMCNFSNFVDNPHKLCQADIERANAAKDELAERCIEWHIDFIKARWLANNPE